MNESLLLFIVLTLVVAVVAGLVVFSQKPTSPPLVTAGSDINNPAAGTVSAQALQAPSGSVIDYTKEESSGTTGGVVGFFRNLF